MISALRQNYTNNVQSVLKSKILEWAWSLKLEKETAPHPRGGMLFLTQAWVLLKWKSTQLDIFILW